MRLRLILGWLLVLSLVASIGLAQQAPARSLSLADALDIARRNSPDYLSVLNDRTPANRNLFSATASLFTPSVSVNGSYSWRDRGTTQYFQGFALPAYGSTQRSTSLSLSYQLSGASIANRGLAAADLRATNEDIAGATTVLETSVRTQYLVLAEAQAQAAVARRSLERATEQLNLAQARYTVGQGTLIDVRRVEVDKGTAEVGLLRANQNTENQTLALFQRMGVPAPEPPQVTLTDSFSVVAPPWSMDPLVAFALEQNPALRSLRARESSARWSTRAARSEYLPSLSLSASTGNNWTRIDTANADTRKARSPWFLFVGVSLPIYNGFARYTRTAQAQARQDDLRQQVRARELQVRADVVAAFHGLETAFRSVALQDANKRASAEALELATQRYRVGSGSYLELLDARLAADRADADYISAVYGYHRAIATLEQAVGRPLR